MTGVELKKIHARRIYYKICISRHSRVLSSRYYEYICLIICTVITHKVIVPVIYVLHNEILEGSWRVELIDHGLHVDCRVAHSAAKETLLLLIKSSKKKFNKFLIQKLIEIYD